MCCSFPLAPDGVTPVGMLLTGAHSTENNFLFVQVASEINQHKDKSPEIKEGKPVSDEEIREKTVQMRNGTLRMPHEGETSTNEDKDFLERSYNCGTEFNKIALKLGRSESAIYQKVEQLGLCTRNPFSMRKRSCVKRADRCLCESCKCDRTSCPLCKVYQSVLEGM